MNLSRSNWLILGAAVVASVIGGYVQHRNQQPAVDSALIGQPAPTATLPDLAGKPRALAEYRGRRVLLNFWATDCGPCLDEMPALDRAQKKFGDQAAIVLGIAMDDPARVRAFLAAHPVSYPIRIGQFTAPSTSLQWGDTQEVLPYSVLVGGDGRIEAVHVGALPADLLTHWLAPATAP